MDLEDLLSSLVADEQEKSTLQELDEEIILFDLNEAHPPSSPEQQDSEQPELPDQIALAPSGIPFFKNDMYNLYTEDTLVWPVQSAQDISDPMKDKADPFLSIIDPGVVNECIANGHLVREVNSSSVLMKYLFHTICCTTDEKLRYSSYNTLTYLLTTCSSVSYIKNELCLALLNLGADLSILQRDMLDYRSHVIPPPSCSASEDAQMTDTQLREVLALLLQFLSQCFMRHKNYTSQDADELILLFIAIALDPKAIDVVLDTHISACIAHSLTLYSSEEDFFERLKDVVERVLEYCSGDLPSVVYLCQACITPTNRGKVLRSAVAFKQLQIHLKLPEEDFVADVQVKDIADLLTRYFETCAELALAYDSYYLIKLIDLCLHLDLIPSDQKNDLSIICDLIEQRFRRSQGSADDMNPTISFQCLVATLSKWKRYLIHSCTPFIGEPVIKQQRILLHDGNSPFVDHQAAASHPSRSMPSDYELDPYDDSLTNVSKNALQEHMMSDDDNEEFEGF